MNAVQVFRRAASWDPQRVFTFDTRSAISYGEADRRSDAIASELIARGFTQGLPLALCAPDSVELLLAVLGAWKAGVLPALIDARSGGPELSFFLENVGARLVAAPGDLHDRLLAAGAPAVVRLETLGRPDGSSPDLHTDDAPLYLSYTSGTTGRPKGAVLLSGPVTQGTACIADRLSLTFNDVILVTTPTTSSFQLVAALLPAIHVGATIGLAAGLPINHTWGLAKLWGATVLVGYPLTLADFVNGPSTDSELRLRLALSGGSPLAPRIKRDYRERFRIPLVESYGQSELGGFMALGSPRDGDALTDGYVGTPLPDRSAHVVGRDGEQLTANSVGEIIVPRGFFAGYWNDPHATSKTLSGGVLHTGDMGTRDPHGRIRVLGRTGEAAAAASRGGFLRELEDAYYEHPQVLHAAVVDVAQRGIQAFVELQPGQSVDDRALTAFAGSHVGPGLTPVNTAVLPKMPRTFSGKVDRRRLAQETGPLTDRRGLQC